MEKLREIKIYVDGRSKEIREKLFELDREIEGLTDRSKELSASTYPFVYIDKYGTIDWGNNMNYFKNSSFKEIKADELLAMKPEKDYSGYEFAPLEPVLVRNFVTTAWELNLFSHLIWSDKNEHITVGSAGWNFCIPFKGNEHLLGTDRDINE